MIEASLLAHYKAKLDKAIEYYLDMFHDKAVRLGADEETWRASCIRVGR